MAARSYRRRPSPAEKSGDSGSAEGPGPGGRRPALAGRWVLRTMVIQGALFGAMVLGIVHVTRNPAPSPYQPRFERHFPVLTWDAAEGRARVFLLDTWRSLREKGREYPLRIDAGDLPVIREQLRAMEREVRAGTWRSETVHEEGERDFALDHGCWDADLEVEDLDAGRQRIRFDCWPNDDMWMYGVYEVVAAGVHPTHFLSVRDGPAQAMMGIAAIPVAFVGGLLLSLLYTGLGALARRRARSLYQVREEDPASGRVPG